jgi:RHS repeat-associated protein
VTQAQNALGHITTKNYDFNTGLLLSEKDPNGQVTGLSTSYAYDSMGRLTSTTLPDGGQVTVNFHGDGNPFTITSTQTATPNPSVATTTTYDGYGRPVKKCTTDPEGDDCSDTVYDANGRISSVSNPHRTTAAGSDGVTTYIYDGLDRQLSVTEPDQNVISNSYGAQTSPVMGQVVLVTDETGRQRRSVSDGFGRVVEVDEPGDGSAGTASSGGLTISGTLQTKPATNPTPGTGSVTISGSEQSKQVGATSATPGRGTISLAGTNQCTPDFSVCDWGVISITVNGAPGSTVSYPNGDPVGFLAQYLTNGFSGNPYVTATWNNNFYTPVITLTAKTSGSSTNYSLSTQVYSNDPTDFSSPSYSATPSGATLTGGSNGSPGTTVYDHGTCNVTVNGTPYSKNFGQGDTTSTIASGLAATITAGSLASASASGATISLTAKTSGASTNYSLSASCSYDSSNFTGPSFSAGASGSSFTGGANGSPAVTDAGTVQMSLAGYSATANYGNGVGQDSTASAVASDLVAKIQAQLPGSNPPFTLSASGANITINWSSVGTAGNVTVTTTSTTTQTANFPKASFASCSITTNPQGCSTTLSGGTDPVLSSLAHPYVSRYFYDLLDHFTCVEQHGNTTGSGCSPAVMAITDNQPPAADATSPWRIRRFAYNSLGQLRWANDPESGLTSFQYNNDGVLTSATDARGIISNFNPPDSPLDALHRVTKKTYSNGDPAVTYAYDVPSFNSIPSSNQIGQMVHMSNGANAASTFAYDPVGRVIKQTNCLPSNCNETANQVTATYDLAGNPSTLTYPSGRKISYSYNSAGHFTKANFDGFNGVTVNFPYYNIPPGTGPSNWGYWPTGAMHTGVFGNGVQQTLGVNARAQVNAITQATAAQTLLSKSYGLYDGSSHNNGNILSIADVLSATRNQTYSYDSLNRISTGSQADGAFNITFSYDPWGNMRESGTSNFQPIFDVRNRIATSPYDAAGNLLNDGLHAYTYDAEGHMKTVDSTGVTYAYGADGRRVRKDVGTTATEFIYFGDRVVAEKNVTTGSWTDYIIAYGEHIAKDSSANASGAQYFHADQIDSTRLVTDSTGAVAWQATYNPFGQELSAQNSGIRFQFAGMEFDNESNLNHTDFRQYASAEGRWMSPDLYSGSLDRGNPQSLNRYVYVQNNPLVLRDPSGLMPGCDPEQPECDDDSLLGQDSAGGGSNKRKDNPLLRFLRELFTCPNGDCGTPWENPLSKLPGSGQWHLKDIYCAVTPNGSTRGVGGSATFSIVGAAGTVEGVYNWDTKELTAFKSGGYAAGNPSAGVNLFAGPAWGLNKGNDNYKAGSTTVSGGTTVYGPVAVGGAASFNSPGFSSPRGFLQSFSPANWSRPATLTLGVGLSTPGASGSVSITHYKKIGNTTTAPPPSIEDAIGVLLRTPCHN